MVDIQRLSAVHSPIDGAPKNELTRSPAAQIIQRLAGESALFLAHYEHRVLLCLPEAWAPEARPDLGDPPDWQRGVLPEPKYQAFRHDQLIGSFHPGHRAKWTSHELCHGVIGFAWAPGAPLLFHALAARLAEALPVALWYFFDEIGLRRCEAHQNGGPLFDAFCAACEQAASKAGPALPTDSPQAQRWRSEGIRFVQRELDAVRHARRTGQLRPHRLGSLDLNSDALAYAAAHGPRLRSRTFHTYIERFFPEKSGWSPSLQALEERVEEVLHALIDGRPVTPWKGGRWRWIAQDLGWRLLQVHADTEGEAATTLDRLIAQLADHVNEAGVRQAMDAYRSLHEDWTLPDPEIVFSVGYDLPGGFGRSLRQMTRGVRSALPATCQLLGNELNTTVARFVSIDQPVRVPVGRRFARYVQDSVQEQPALRATAHFEAILAHPPAVDLEAQTLKTDHSQHHQTALRLSPGAELACFDADAPAVLEAVLSNEAVTDAMLGPTQLVAVALPNGELGLIPVSTETASKLEGQTDALEAESLPEADRQLLVEVGALVPESSPPAWGQD